MEQTYPGEWQAAQQALVNAGFSDERIKRLLVEEPKATNDPITNVPRNDFEALHAFQKLMWEKLMKNQHKGGWTKLPLQFLYERLRDEMKELKEYLMDLDVTSTVDVRKAAALECADIANFAMFIADVLGQLEYKRRNDHPVPTHT